MDGDRWPVLTDIAGEEDHYGDMDFKVAGTRDGHHRPADGHQDRRASPPRSWPTPSSRRAQGRLHILDRMAEALAAAAHRHQRLRAAHPHHPGPGRQDPRHHRTGRQDDPLDRRADGLQDRRRGRRPRVDRLGGRGGGPQGRSRSSRSSPPPPSSTRPTWARWSAWSSSAPSSRSCPAPTACCTSPRWPTTACNDVHDEVKEGDQVLVKVVSIDPSGKIRLSRKALLEEAQGGGAGRGVRHGRGGGPRPSAAGGRSHGRRPPSRCTAADTVGDRRPGGGRGGPAWRPGRPPGAATTAAAAGLTP